MLLELKQPALALKEFEASAKREPDRKLFSPRLGAREHQVGEVRAGHPEGAG